MFRFELVYCKFMCIFIVKRIIKKKNKNSD